MPVMDGLTATKHIRQNGYVKPIIALTAHDTTIHQQQCFDAGKNLGQNAKLLFRIKSNL